MYIHSEYPFKCCVLQPAKEVGQLILYKEKIPTPIFTRYSILDLYDQSKTGLKLCFKSHAITCRTIYFIYDSESIVYGFFKGRPIME